MLKRIQLHWQILIALVLSIIFGITFPNHVKYVSWMGDLFLRALSMIIVPLIFSSIVSGVTGIGSGKNLGRMTAKTIGYYMITSLFAIITGLLLVNLIKPGVGADLGLSKAVEGLAASGDSFGQTLLKIIPTNIIESMARADLPSIIFFAIFFGFFATRVESKYSEPVINFFNAVFGIMMKITMFVIKFTPIGIFGIVSVIIAENSENLAAIFGRMGIYMLTVIAALAIHGVITLPLLMRILGKANPIKHARNMSVPLLTAFSTSSSSATLPLTLEAVEFKSGVSNKTTSFVLPLGATINMDGTALYQCIAVLFIAQAYGIELSILQQLIVMITALLASIGAAGIPMAGLVIMSIILSAVGLPLEGIGLILAVDRILDMIRTTVNVWSDSCGAVIIAKSEGEVTNV
ncbi:MAG: dicarboxylate/amino acid:cation symporter [Bacteroidales bacterium]|nr:dicarboxylate/amino acid:cation symporter [Bacteroidales bacterium]